MMGPGKNQSLVLHNGKSVVLNDNIALELAARGLILYCAGCDAYHLEQGVTFEHVEKETEIAKV